MNVAPPQSRRLQRPRYLAWGIVLLITSLLVATVLVFSQDSPDCVGPNQVQSVPGGPCVTQPGMSQELIGLHVPWAIGGPAIERDGTLNERSPKYPDFAIDTVRLWDTRTAWLNLEPAQDQWDFSNLDAHIDQARTNGVQDITLVLWGTPSWAASSIQSTDAHWLGPGSASMPTSLADWEDYVTTIATRYQGVITAYEIGNEPNVKSFWNGTDQELVKMVRTASQIIKGVDPAATVVAPAPVLVTSDSPSVRSVSNFWRELNATTSGEKDGAQVDALSFHWYPGPQTNPRELENVLKVLNNQAKRAGMAGVPIWLTEVNYYQGNLTAEQQRNKVIATNEMIKKLKIPRTYWYAWTDLASLEFMQFGPGTPAELGLRESLKTY